MITTATNEDYMHLYGATDEDKKGSWNDYVIDNNNVDAYIIEYGGHGRYCYSFWSSINIHNIY